MELEGRFSRNILRGCEGEGNTVSGYSFGILEGVSRNLGLELDVGTGTGTGGVLVGFGDAALCLVVVEALGLVSGLTFRGRDGEECDRSRTGYGASIVAARYSLETWLASLKTFKVWICVKMPKR